MSIGKFCYFNELIILSRAHERPLRARPQRMPDKVRYTHLGFADNVDEEWVATASDEVVDEADDEDE